MTVTVNVVCDPIPHTVLSNKRSSHKIDLLHFHRLRTGNGAGYGVTAVDTVLSRPRVAGRGDGRMESSVVWAVACMSMEV